MTTWTPVAETSAVWANLFTNLTKRNGEPITTRDGQLITVSAPALTVWTVVGATDTGGSQGGPSLSDLDLTSGSTVLNAFI